MKEFFIELFTTPTVLWTLPQELAMTGIIVGVAAVVGIILTAIGRRKRKIKIRRDKDEND